MHCLGCITAEIKKIYWVLQLLIDLTRSQIPPRGPGSSIQLVCHKPISCNSLSVTQRPSISSSLLGIILVRVCVCVRAPTWFQRRATRKPAVCSEQISGKSRRFCTHLPPVSGCGRSLIFYRQNESGCDGVLSCYRQLGGQIPSTSFAVSITAG